MAWPKTVRKGDLCIEFFRGSGPGGQHRNKRDTACRMTHIPTGIQTTAQDSRSQADNRRAAFRKLTEKLAPLMRAAAVDRPEVVRSTERVRTYHDKRGVKDDRLPGRTFGFQDVLHGRGLDRVLAALRRE